MCIFLKKVHDFAGAEQKNMASQTAVAVVLLLATAHASLYDLSATDINGNTVQVLVDFDGLDSCPTVVYHLNGPNRVDMMHRDCCIQMSKYSGMVSLVVNVATY